MYRSNFVWGYVNYSYMYRRDFVKGYVKFYVRLGIRHIENSSIFLASKIYTVWHTTIRSSSKV